MKKKCSICSKRFEPVRSDAKYCSNACKQKAHTLRKKGVEPKQESKLVFYLDEYTSVRDFYEIKSPEMPLIFYCFLRMNLPTEVDQETIIKYLDAVWIGDNRKELMETNAYRSFKEHFLNNQFEILRTKV